MPGFTVSIRQADEADLPAVTRILHDCVAAMQRDGIDQWDDVYPTDGHLRGDIRERSMYVASTPTGEIVGTVVLNEQENPEYSAVPWTSRVRPLVVHRVMVAPDHQGQGIAEALMTFAEQHAREAGYASIRLDAFTLNPRALRLYERLGYAARGTIRLRKGMFWCVEKVLDRSTR
jgi:GNAT superfamily N-acetyltransferase